MASVTRAQRIHPWAELGQRAFSKAYPHLAEQVPFPDFYVCPLCLHAFNTANGSQAVTRDHVPPEKLGGRRMVLTCSKCNSHVAGTGLDADASHEADLYGFMEGNVRPTKGALVTQSGQLPARLHAADNNVVIRGVPKAIDPANQTAVMSDFDWATQGENWKDFRITWSFQPFYPKRAETSWLRTAYLAFFASLGYQFIMRPELQDVRDKFKDPLGHPLAGFRALIPPAERLPEPTLMLVQDPEPFRSYAMFYERNVVFLPRRGDDRLYGRLADQPAGHVSWTGRRIPWPTSGPTFSADLGIS